MEDKLLLTIPEVAEILGASVNYTYRMAERRVFPVIRLSHRNLRVPREAFEEWLRSKTEWPADFARQK